MLRIKHSDAIMLEHIVRNLYKCDRAGVSGLADADNFEQRPFDAAIMIVCFIHAHNLQQSETQFDSFLCEYEAFFNSNEEDDDKVNIFIDKLSNIAEIYKK